MANFSNISEEARSPETKDTSWYWWFNGVIAVITVLGNALIILLILTRPSLRTTQNCFVLSLAVADFLLGSVTFVIRLVFFYLYLSHDYVYHFIAIFDFLIYASTTNLCALTLDRYISVVHPLKYIHMIKKSNVIKTLMAAWVAAFVFSFVLLLMNLFVKSNEVIRGYHVFLLCFFETFPCVCLPVAYFRILYFVRRQQTLIKVQTNQLQHNFPMNNETQRNVIKNKMMIRVLGGVIGFFVISHVFLISRAWVKYVLNIPKSILPLMNRIAFPLIYANSAVNVFFYGIFKKDFRGEIVRLSRKLILPSFLEDHTGPASSFGLAFDPARTHLKKRNNRTTCFLARDLKF